MKRSTAFELLGGDVASVARNLGCSTQAVYKWCRIGDDDPVPRAIADRVLAAAVRLHAQRMRAQGETLVPLEEDAVTL
jgi:transposase-like protein